ncbi:MAG: outer membrane beta-barrel protein [Saprospiraceae bacterium]|nr:outer membrane beta-barrel protein [Saprospiraceae bacterium]
MKFKIIQNMLSNLSNALFYRAFKNSLLICVVGLCLPLALSSQALQYTRPSWWIGLASGANFNFYRGSTQKMNADFTAPVPFHDGTSVGLYLAPLLEYYHPGAILGISLQAGFDSKRGSFDQVITPCNCPADLNTNLSYVTIEPSVRISPMRSNFYLFGGPRFAFNVAKSFNYSLGINPDFPEQEPTPDVNGDLSDVKKTLVSLQVGAGYDIYLSSQMHRTQFVLSPFISYQPYFGQSPRTIETWNITSLRVGAAIKFGMGTRIPTPSEIIVNDPEVRFTVIAPKNIPVDRKVREIFPMRNYVFFDLGSTEIPQRYELLSKSQVKEFKEDQVELFVPKNLTGRSQRQMIVYYNILNILGDRMGKNTQSTINLVGSSENGPLDGQKMAEAIETYLVDVFGINSLRINTSGQDKPNIPSEKPGGTRDLTLLREGDRRVSIETNSPDLLMEFQNGSNSFLKPVEILVSQEAPLDSYVSFNASGANVAFSSWNLEIRDDKNLLKSFGPFYQDQVSIPGKSILGTRLEGDYKVTMVGLTKAGKTVRRETKVHMVLWKAPENIEGMRYSVIYEFDESKAIQIYDKYLKDVVIPKIPINSKVLIHGYTDIIGDETHNLNLSLARANDVLRILEKGLQNANRTDVKFELYGFGEDQNVSPFNNEFPEERFYNRTVIIDIIPLK